MGTRSLFSRMGTRSLFSGVLLTAALGVASVSADAQTTPPTCFGQPATIVGTSAGDMLQGTDGPDVIVGRGGQDTIYGLGGDDLICGNGAVDPD
jgi:Ca2+-binding RTX toxin-like protein